MGCMFTGSSGYELCMYVAIKAYRCLIVDYSNEVLAGDQNIRRGISWLEMCGATAHGYHEAVHVQVLLEHYNLVLVQRNVFCCTTVASLLAAEHRHFLCLFKQV